MPVRSSEEHHADQDSSRLKSLAATDAVDHSFINLDKHCCNEHLASVYEMPHEVANAAGPFLQKGLEEGEKCIYVIDDTSTEFIVSDLEQRGVDVDDALISGDLEFLTGERYITGSEFDPSSQLQFLEDSIEDANETHGSLRLAVEMTCFLEHDLDYQSFIGYEERYNEISRNADAFALCMYNREKFPNYAIRDTIKVHPYLYVDGLLSNNPFYSSPERFFGPEDPEEEVNRMIEVLSKRVEREEEIKNLENRLRNENEIKSDPEKSFDDKIQSLFELGCERFDLEGGVLALVDDDESNAIIENMSSGKEYFERGVEIPLSETNVSELTGENCSVSVVHPFDEGYINENLFEESGLRTYIGTYIEMAEWRDRILFFISSRSREETFTEDEHSFHSLMGKWVKHELETELHRKKVEEIKKELEKKNRRLSDFISDVASDINDTGSRRVVEKEAETYGVPPGIAVRLGLEPSPEIKRIEFNPEVSGKDGVSASITNKIVNYGLKVKDGIAVLQPNLTDLSSLPRRR
ncbi:MAG: MEDS domain-containing protein [Halobacteria archaeon]